MECADGDKWDRVYFNRRNVEFSRGKKYKTSALVKNAFNMVCNFFFIWKVKVVFLRGKQNSRNTNQARPTLCKECNHWITQLVLLSVTRPQLPLRQMPSMSSPVLARPKPPRMISSSANCRPLFSSFPHSLPQERLV